MVGAASRDVTIEDPRGWRLGGAVAYASLALARLGVATRALVGVDAEAAHATEVSLLREAGVEVALAPLPSGPVFENLETEAGRRQHCLAVSSAIETHRLPAGWAIDANAVVLAPVAGELRDGWSGVANGDAVVALGWQGLLRGVVAGRDVSRIPPAAGPLVARAELLGVSEEDVGPDVRLRDLVELIRVGSTLVLTRGERGGTALTSRRPARSSLRAYPAIPSNGVVDATGAGDVFLAALVATAIDGSRLRVGPGWPDRLTFAAAAASLTVERPGLAGVPELPAIRRRVAEVA
ncbi:MAG TPA: PfkB family carbohydrate kinase [Candidatus Limnocylindrales bacterium]|nr:PfkB family carbohydrate kinase [Candidatus Limnocylindrales bacterium]